MILPIIESRERYTIFSLPDEGAPDTGARVVWDRWDRLTKVEVERGPAPEWLAAFAEGYAAGARRGESEADSAEEERQRPDVLQSFARTAKRYSETLGDGCDTDDLIRLCSELAEYAPDDDGDDDSSDE